MEYHEAGWVARRWDWFNKGEIVKPKSFCQLWRTVLLYATVKQLIPLFIRRRYTWLCAWAEAERNKTYYKESSTTPRWALRMGGFISTIARGLWTLAHPLRKTLGFAAKKTIDAIEWLGANVLQFVFTALVVMAVMAFVGGMLFALTLAFLNNWQGMVLGPGVLIGAGFALYGLSKSGVLSFIWGVVSGIASLIWGAAVAAKHGICPPVEILRGRWG